MTKHPLKSWTIWLNIILMALGIWGRYLGVDESARVALINVALLNIGLRVKSRSKLEIRKRL